MGQAQRTYARVAGILFPGVILLAIGGSVLLSKIAGEGNFAETAARIRASEHLYRAALSSVLVVTISSALLAFSLFVTLAPVNRRLAQLGLIFCLGDSFLAPLVRMCGFVMLHLYVAWRDPGVPAEPVSELLRAVAATTETLGGILFGIGSVLFFYLVFKSRYVPRWIAALGGIASGIWTTKYFAGLIFPENHARFHLACFPPMLLAEVVTGVYLALFTVRTNLTS